MKRRIGTALSVLGLLAVGTAAAAVNVRLLHSAGSESAQFQMSNTGDVTPLTSPAADVTPSATPESTTATLGTPSPLASDPNAGPGKPHPSGAPSLGAVGSVGGPGGFDDDGDGDHHGFGDDDGDRPQLTDAQMTLLRVSAMLRLDPQTVRAVARGENTDANLVAVVTEAAKAVGTTLKELGAVENLPPIHDRGHGGHGGGHDGGGFGLNPSGSSSNTYDD